MHAVSINQIADILHFNVNASYVDDNTLYASGSNSDAVINNKQHILMVLEIITWRVMLTNTLLVTGNYEASVNINKFESESSKKEELLGIWIDTKLSLEEHIASLCKKASQKLHALARITHYLE